MEDAISGAKIAPCLPALAVTSLPLCLWWENRPVRRQLASSILCSVRVLLWESSLSLFFFLSPAILQFVLLSHIKSLRFSSGHSGPVLTPSMQPMPPCSAPTCWWQTRVSGLLLHWELQFGMYSVCVCVFFPSLLCCPLRFQNSPQTRQ